MNQQEVEDFLARARKALVKEFGEDLILQCRGKTDNLGMYLAVNLTNMLPSERQTKLEADWVIFGDKHGLDLGDLKRGVIYKRKPYKIVGLEPRSRRTPILAQDADGRVLAFPITSIAPLSAPEPIPEPPKPEPLPATVGPVVYGEPQTVVPTGFDEDAW